MARRMVRSLTPNVAAASRVVRRCSDAAWFCPVSGVRCPLVHGISATPARPPPEVCFYYTLSHHYVVQHEREKRDLTIFCRLKIHHQSGVEDPVRAIVRFVRKVELRNQERLLALRAPRLGDDVDVASTTRVEPRHDSLQFEATVLVGKLMTAQAIPLVVIDPRIVG